MGFFNEERLKNYPRIIAAIFIIVFLVNIITRDGWKGGIGGYISYDFLTFYAIGNIYWSDATNLYDPETLFLEEQKVFLPTSLDGGWNIFSYPPYVAMASGVLTILPYSSAYYLWTIINIASILVSAYLLHLYLTQERLNRLGLSTFQLSVIVFSIFPVIFGLILGQNHGLTLLLITALLIFSLKEKWIYTGVLAGFLIYKPHFVIGFLIIWLVWRKFRALAAFGLIAGIWTFAVLVTTGLEPFRDYLQILPELVTIPLGAGDYLEMTPYALLLNIFSIRALDILVILNQIAVILAGAGVVWLAYKTRYQELEKQKYLYVIALLFPFIASPHMLIHDLVLLIPVFILWADLSPSKHVSNLAIITYFGFLFLPFLTYITGVSLLALLPLIILILFLRDYLPIVIIPN